MQNPVKFEYFWIFSFNFYLYLFMQAIYFLESRHDTVSFDVSLDPLSQFCIIMWLHEYIIVEVRAIYHNLVTSCRLYTTTPNEHLILAWGISELLYIQITLDS